MLEAFAHDPSTYEATLLAWRRARLSRLTAPDSWLSLIGKFSLAQGDNTAGAVDGCDVLLPHDKAPSQLGVFTLRERVVTFTASVAISLQASQGTRVLAPGQLVTLASDRATEPDRVRLGSLSLEVMERASGFSVRVRDSQSPARLHFPGIDYHPITPSLRIVAKLERYEPPKSIDLAYETGSTEHYASPGAALFEIDGQPCRLDPVLDGDRPRLYVVFWDLTSRDTSYGAGRFLYAPLPQGDRVLLDFNQAFSPPCAFTPYAVCPLPPPQNRLQVRIEAGEKRPTLDVSL